MIAIVFWDSSAKTGSVPSPLKMLSTSFEIVANGLFIRSTGERSDSFCLWHFSLQNRKVLLNTCFKIERQPGTMTILCHRKAGKKVWYQCNLPRRFNYDISLRKGNSRGKILLLWTPRLPIPSRLDPNLFPIVFLFIDTWQPVAPEVVTAEPILQQAVLVFIFGDMGHQRASNE